MTDKKIALFIPPAYDRVYPPLGTPCLASFLKSKKMDVVQDDLNILYYEYIKTNKMDRIFTKEYRENKIRKKVYYSSVLQYKGAHGSTSYGFENNPGSSFAFTEMMLSSKFLHRYIADKKENPFVDFFHKKALPRLKNKSPDIVGLSIICPSQVLASFTLGYFIKKYFPEIKIVVGGQWVSFYREELQERSDFARFYDYAIYFEGETPFFNLIDSLQNNKPLSEVPNLIYMKDGDWKMSDKHSYENMNELPAPDFEGLPLKKYFGSKKDIALTFETSRGCYWGKCVFCIDLPLPQPMYREKTPDIVIRDIKVLMEKYKVKYLSVSNATFSPSQMREISKRILREGIKISWWTMARLDNGFDRDTLRLAKKAGCSMIGFGLESANQRVLDFVNKGTKFDIIKRIIRDARKLKLGIYFQTMIGIPSETMEEALDTLGFLTRHPDAVGRNPAFNIYYLIPKNRVFQNPKQYGIKIDYSRPLPFKYFYSFKQIAGNIDRSKAQKIIIAYSSMIKQMKTQKIDIPV